MHTIRRLCGKTDVIERGTSNTSAELTLEHVWKRKATFLFGPEVELSPKVSVELWCDSLDSGTVIHDNTIDRVMAGGTLVLTAKDLEPNCRYRCYVNVCMSGKVINRSNVVVIKTHGLPSRPTDFRILKTGKDYIGLSWYPSVFDSTNDKFILEVTDLLTADFEEIILPMKHELPYKYVVEPLKPANEYSFTLYALNEIGKSEPTQTLTAQTIGKPEQPVNFQEEKEARTPSSVTVSWTPGFYRREKQSFFVVYGISRSKLVRIKWAKGTEILDDRRSTTMYYTIGGLEPGKTYSVALIAQNDCGITKLDTPPLQVHTTDVPVSEDVKSQSELSTPTPHNRDSLNDLDAYYTDLHIS